MENIALEVQTSMIKPTPFKSKRWPGMEVLKLDSKLDSSELFLHENIWAVSFLRGENCRNYQYATTLKMELAFRPQVW